MQHVAALDGLRALSILAVLAGHAGITRVRGSVQGVTVFFVISGYLITTLLIREHQQHGSISFLGFYRRRFARLMPAFLMAIAATVVYLLATGVPLNEFWVGPVSAALYVANEVAAQGRMNTLTQTFFAHNWSLTIEEQFYLVWPVLLFFFLARGRLRLAALTAAGAAAASIGLRLYLSFTHAPDQLIKWSTATRLDGIMIGCLLAIVLISPSFERRVSPLLPRLTPIAGFALAVIVLQGALVRVDPNGYTAAALASAVLVCSIVLGRSPRLARALSNRVLTWVGRLSYSLYLWNVLLMEAFVRAAGLRPAQSSWGLIWLLGVFAIAQLCYSFIEQPLRRRLSGPRKSRARATPQQVATT